MNEMFGWIQGSKVPGIYVHMSGRDVDEALLKLHGLVEGDDEKETQLKAKKCPRCGTISAEKFCSKCGAPLDIKTVMEIEDRAKEIDDKLAYLLRDEEVKQVLVRKLKEMV
jgi:ribosomal protein S27AE